MRRAWTGTVGVVLTLLAATGRADEELVWRAVSGAPPVVVDSPRGGTSSAQPIVLTDAPVRVSDVPGRITVLPPELLDPPRKEKENSIPGPGSWGTGTGNAAGTNATPTYNLVAEHRVGEEAPPVDVGRRLWLRGEFLTWWMRPQSAPPLVSTVFPNLVPGPLTFTPGAIGTPGQLTLLGDGSVGGSFLLGGRFTAGVWLNDCQTCGLEARYFFLGPRSERFRADSNTNPIIARPIFAPNPFNGVPLGETAQIVAIPPGFTLPGGAPAPAQTGAITVDTSSYLWGAEINAREALWVCGGCDAGKRIDLFVGFRYLDLQESLRVQEDIVLLTADQNGRPPGSTIQVVDFFGTHDQFYGGQIGVS